MGVGVRLLQGAPLGSGGLQGASYVRISAGCAAPAASVPQAPGEPGGRGGGGVTNAGASAPLFCTYLRKDGERQGAPRRSGLGLREASP